MNNNLIKQKWSDFVKNCKLKEFAPSDHDSFYFRSVTIARKFYMLCHLSFSVLYNTYRVLSKISA